MSQPSGGAAAPRPMVAANWKMNGLRRDGRDLARALARLKGAAGEPACDFVVCPPAALLFELRDDLLGAGMALGGQDCHAEAKGAHTGDISAELLGDCGCEYVILGHSERRANHGETSAMVSAKVAAAERLFSRYGAWAILVAAFTPLPYKVFAILAGILDMDRRRFVVASLIGRGARFFLLGGLIFVYGDSIEGFTDRNFTQLTIALGVGSVVVVGLGALYAHRRRARNAVS